MYNKTNGLLAAIEPGKQRQEGKSKKTISAKTFKT